MKTFLLLLFLSLVQVSFGQNLCGPNDSLCSKDDCEQLAYDIMYSEFIENYQHLDVEYFNLIGYNITVETHDMCCVEEKLTRARERALATWDFYVYRMQTEFCSYKCMTYPTRCPYYDEDPNFWLMYGIFQNNLFWDTFNLIEETATDCQNNCQF